MSILAQRFLFGFLLLGGVFLILGVDGWLDSSLGFLALSLLFLVGGWIEFARITSLARVATVSGVLFLTAALLGDSWLARSGEHADLHQLLLMLVPVAWPGWLFLWLVGRPAERAAFRDLALATLGFLWLLFPMLCFVRLRVEFGDQGLWWLAAMILIVKGNDIGAYLTGRWLGRTPLSPISPGKTREGSAGGLALGIVAAVLFALFTDPPLFGWQQALLIGPLVGVAGQLGDLAESYLKRCFDAKDSGALIPTYGGVLDLLDSLLFGGPVLYLLGRCL